MQLWSKRLTLRSKLINPTRRATLKSKCGLANYEIKCAKLIRCVKVYFVKAELETQVWEAGSDSKLGKQAANQVWKAKLQSTLVKPVETQS